MMDLANVANEMKRMAAHYKAFQEAVVVLESAAAIEAELEGKRRALLQQEAALMALDAEVTTRAHTLNAAMEDQVEKMDREMVAHEAFMAEQVAAMEASVGEKAAYYDDAMSVMAKELEERQRDFGARMAAMQAEEEAMEAKLKAIKAVLAGAMESVGR